MAFHMYPTALRVPLRLGAGSESPLTPFVETCDESGSMFIRICQCGVGDAEPSPSAPTVRIRAGSGEVVGVPRTGTVPIFSRPGNSSVQCAAAQVRFLDCTDANVQLIRIDVLDRRHAWYLQMRNNDRRHAQEYTWVVSNNIEQTRQPWIDMPTDLSLGTSARSPRTATFRIINRGTGPLTVTDQNDGAAGDTRLDRIEPAAILPGRWGSAWVRLPAGVPRTREVRYPLASNDPRAGENAGHNHVLRLTPGVRGVADGEEQPMDQDTGHDRWPTRRGTGATHFIGVDLRPDVSSKGGER